MVGHRGQHRSVVGVVVGVGVLVLVLVLFLTRSFRLNVYVNKR